MISSFLSLVSLVVLPAVAVAQLPASPYAVPSPCANGQCRPVQAAATVAHAAVVNAAEVVRGVWTTPTQPWYTPLPATVPQTMPKAAPQLVLSGPILNALGIRRVVVEFASPGSARSLFRPFGGRFRR